MTPKITVTHSDPNSTPIVVSQDGSPDTWLNPGESADFYVVGGCGLNFSMAMGSPSAPSPDGGGGTGPRQDA